MIGTDVEPLAVALTAHAKIVVPFIAQMETSDASIGTAFASQQ
jgi:hypothetical protein